MKTKNELANEIYGEDYSDLTRGQKNIVGREYNNQDEDEDIVEESVEAVTAKIGRIGHNGVKECMLTAPATVADLLAQSGYVIDDRKEKIILQSTGDSVTPEDEVEDGDVFMIAPEVKSA